MTWLVEHIDNQNNQICKLYIFPFRVTRANKNYAIRVEHSLLSLMLAPTYTRVSSQDVYMHV